MNVERKLLVCAVQLKALIVSLLLCTTMLAQEAKPQIARDDRIRMAEAFRMNEKLSDRVWKGWSKTPFAVLLVTPEYEFLVRHPKP
ncbi:MAG: hypothetical protein H0U54_17835, partial [Acidobacteria bacterium]|nr:hypothetical protein [Acidobacteriota bacterium]